MDYLGEQLHPFNEINSQKAICNAAWTSTVKDLWKAKLIADKSS